MLRATQFSIKELLIVLGIAAIVLGSIRGLGFDMGILSLLLLGAFFIHLGVRMGSSRAVLAGATMCVIYVLLSLMTFAPPQRHSRCNSLPPGIPERVALRGQPSGKDGKGPL